MNFLKIALVAIVFLVNVVIAPPSWAGQDHTKGADYAEVTQAINQLLQVKDTPEQVGYTPEEYQAQLAKLQAQKYIMESTTTRAQCHNQTRGNLAVYANKPKKLATQIYYLAPGFETDDDWDCDGYYLPTGTQIMLQPSTEVQTLAEPLVITFVDGTQSIAHTNPAGALEFNLAPASILKGNEVTWAVPTLSQADIDIQMPSQEIID